MLPVGVDPLYQWDCHCDCQYCKHTSHADSSAICACVCDVQVVNTRLSPNCKARLTVENDDRTSLYSVVDLMRVHQATGVNWGGVCLVVGATLEAQSAQGVSRSQVCRCSWCQSN